MDTLFGPNPIAMGSVDRRTLIFGKKPSAEL